MDSLKNLVNLTGNEKDKKDDNRMVKLTFYITYAFLLTTATVTFIEAMRNDDAKIRHILNLETCISVVAAYFYSMFMKKVDVPNINFRDITLNRYADWAITTPIMLLVLMLALAYNNNEDVRFSMFAIVLVANYGMLYSGYLGETKKVNKLTGNLVGFGFFIAMYYVIWYNHIRGKTNFDNILLYGAFVLLWTGYGIGYWMKEKEKNVTYNVLDLMSKCFVGIFFWAYLTGVIKL